MGEAVGTIYTHLLFAVAFLGTGAYAVLRIVLLEYPSPLIRRASCAVRHNTRAQMGV